MTAGIDRAEKLPINAAQGGEWCWLVNPVLRMLEVLQLQERQWLVMDASRDDAVVQASPFAEQRLELGGLWG